MSNKAVIKLILIVLWMFVIFYFSAQAGDESASISNRVVIKIAETIHHTLSNTEKEVFIEKFSLTVRKLAHMIEYFILSILIYLFLIEFYPKDKYLFLLVILLAIFYALTDEIHQLFVPGRYGSIIDVLIDSMGAFLGTLMCFNYRHKILKKL